MSRRRDTPATEQPGNSFRYLYWRLSEKDFQRLCTTLLVDRHKDVRCFPVGMADEGIDALVRRVGEGGLVYQVKWSSKVEQNPDRWLESTIKAEKPKIERLIRERGITGYTLMTSVAGTTTSTGTGSIQKLDTILDELTEELKIPVKCMWQSDIDAAVDLAPDSLKWAYPEMLAGVNAIRYLMEGSKAEKTRDTILKVMATQAGEDAKIKFSQVDLDHVPLTDLFVDVRASLTSAPRNALEAFHSAQDDEVNGSTGAVRHLLATRMPLTFLLGVPGQGKSTLGQYLAQIHRLEILPDGLYDDPDQQPASIDEPKLPLRVDLKDDASWISGTDPYGEIETTNKPRMRAKKARSLELFLADFCEAMSGGRSTSVEEVQGLLDRFPTLLVLDGLDEVADPDLRQIVVQEINNTCTRMAAGAEKGIREFQVLVTARPNASNLAEPDPATFQTLQLEPLDDTLQAEYVDKWCKVNDITGKKRRELQRTFQDRTRLDHVAQLADNPMQLTILLTLIKRKGDAVPVSRTPLYAEYMDTLMGREVDRQQIHSDQVTIVEEVTAFLGWLMHSRVETAPQASRMSRQDIVTTLLLYFHITNNAGQDPEQLFRVASDRFWALTSKVDGTFEFVVQPVREYFAASFLAHWIARDARMPPAKEDVLKELVTRTYWTNVARFYAGFAHQNEIAGLRYGLESAIADDRHPLQVRSAAWVLLADGVFMNRPNVQADVVRMLTDDLTVVLAVHAAHTIGMFPPLAAATGRDQMTAALLDDLAHAPDQALAESKAIMLRRKLRIPANDLVDWFLPHLRAAAGTDDQNAWLRLAGYLGLPYLQDSDAALLRLESVDDLRSALAASASPNEGTPAAAALLQTVLDGYCSDVATKSHSEAGALVQAIRPEFFHDEARDPSALPNTRKNLDSPGEAANRSNAWSELKKFNKRYNKLQTAARSTGMGRKGTTEHWQATARELTNMHGPSWLAAEIAIAGAASCNTRPEGTIDPDGEPFGRNVDFGTFVVEVHRRPASSWWQNMYDSHEDELSRRIWAVALLATTPPGWTEHLPKIDNCFRALSVDDFEATAATTSRLGASHPERRIPADAWADEQWLDARTKLVLAHFTADLVDLDALAELSEEELEAAAIVAGESPAAWPIVRAVSARMVAGATPAHLRLLAHMGCQSPSRPSRLDLADAFPDESVVNALLSEPQRYLHTWVIAAERHRQGVSKEQPLSLHARELDWVPTSPGL